MKKKALSLIIGLMSLSLLGLIGLQAYWVRHAMLVKEEQFDRSVNDALNQVVHQLEVREMASGLQKTLAAAQKIQAEAELKQAAYWQQKPAPVKRPIVKISQPAPNLPATTPGKKEAVKGRRPEEKVLVYRKIQPETELKIYRYNAADAEMLRQLQQQARPGARDLIADSLRKNGIYRQAIIRTNSDSVPMLFRLHHDSVFKMLNAGRLAHINDVAPTRFYDSLARTGIPTPTRKIKIKADTLILPDNTPKKQQNLKPVAKPVGVAAIPEVKPVVVKEEVIKRKEAQVNQVMEKMVMEMVTKEVPLRHRLNFTDVDSLVASALADKNIDLPYAVAIAGSQPDSLLHVKQVNARFAPNLPQYKVSLFPNDLVQKPDYLMLQFPDKQQYVLGSMVTMLSASAAFTLIMIVTFGATLGFIFRQKKISEIKSDFINNMTHEFKTPIATISLATDAINSPKVLADSNRINYYTGIIQQENKRMLSQVENVLQMALLDRQDLKLNFEVVALDELLNHAIANLKLQAESRNGQLTFTSGTAGMQVYADKLHLGNVFLNLLDNAFKYSPERPVISVTSEVKNDKAYITISDQGIGMSAEEQKRVFDKFYRVPTGNLHNVKGFGLGLAYVKAMAEQHKGHVSVKSSAGKGSSFQVCLPVYKA